MDKLDYCESVQILLKKHHSHQSDDEIEVKILFDAERDRYLILYIGWQEERRVCGSVIHIDIKDSNIWIQCDKTEVGVARELVELGVPKSDIVLAFQSPYKRQFTEYAVG